MAETANPFPSQMKRMPTQITKARKRRRLHHHSLEILDFAEILALT